MKSVLFIAVATICSVCSWGQVLSVVNIGNSILDKNNFTIAKQIFERNGLPLNPDFLSKTPEIHASSLIGENKYESVLGAIYAYSKEDKRIEQVTFMIGEYYQDRVVDDLKALGYKYTGKVEMATLPNGVSVPQVTWIKGTKCCMIHAINNAELLYIIFTHIGK